MVGSAIKFVRCLHIDLGLCATGSASLFSRWTHNLHRTGKTSGTPVPGCDKALAGSIDERRRRATLPDDRETVFHAAPVSDVRVLIGMHFTKSLFRTERLDL